MAALATVAGARADLMARLAAAGLQPTETTGGAVPPQCFLVPGEPFVEPYALGAAARTVKYTIVQLVTTASDQAMAAQTDQLADALSKCIVRDAGSGYVWSVPTVSSPRSYDVGGATYAALTADVSTIIQST